MISWEKYAVKSFLWRLEFTVLFCPLSTSALFTRQLSLVTLGLANAAYIAQTIKGREKFPKTKRQGGTESLLYNPSYSTKQFSCTVRSASALFKAQLQSNLGSLNSMSKNIATNTVAIIIQTTFATKLNLLKGLGVNKSLHHVQAFILQMVWTSEGAAAGFDWRWWVSRDSLLLSAANPCSVSNISWFSSSCESCNSCCDISLRVISCREFCLPESSSWGS